jgi:hypothetical protein
MRRYNEEEEGEAAGDDADDTMDTFDDHLVFHSADDIDSDEAGHHPLSSGPEYPLNTP